MSGLPTTKSAVRQQDAFDVMVCGGIEKLTYKLRAGEPFTDNALVDMRKLSSRLKAFDAALAARLKAAGIGE